MSREGPLASESVSSLPLVYLERISPFGKLRNYSAVPLSCCYPVESRTRQPTSIEAREGGVPSLRRPASAPRWNSEVNSFLNWKRTESSVGNDWIRRMNWELLRVPSLLRRIDAPSIARSSGEFRVEHVAVLRDRLPWERATFMIHFSALR